MPFMVVDESEYERELRKLNSDETTRSIEITELEKGRGPVREIPQELREVIAEEKLNGTKAKELERIFDVSASSISAYAHGATSTASYNKPTDKLNQVRNRISSRAANRLNDALRALSTKDLSVESARDISAVAKDMATVFDKIAPVKIAERENDKHLHLHMYVPKMKSVNDYEILDLNEKQGE